MKRLFRVTYLYELVTNNVHNGTIKKAKLTCEVRGNLGQAFTVGDRLARGCCKTMGDERFLRVIAVKEAGQVTR